MNTTTLIVDYLIIGVESCSWIFILLATIEKIKLENKWIMKLKDIPDIFIPIVIGLIIAFVYAIGIVTNEVYNVFFKVCKENRERNQILENKFPKSTDRPKNWHLMRDYVSARNYDVVRRYEIWNLPKIRILRATAMNFFLLGFFIFLYSWISSGFKYSQALDIRVISIIFSFWLFAGFALWQWHHRMKNYYDRLADSYISLKSLGSKKTANKNQGKAKIIKS